jgi:hypothetical protein
MHRIGLDSGSRLSISEGHFFRAGRGSFPVGRTSEDQKAIRKLGNSTDNLTELEFDAFLDSLLKRYRPLLKSRAVTAA